MDDDEVFDLSTINEYELLSNEDGTVLIQENCVVIKHNETQVVKMLPMTEEVLQVLGLAVVLDDDDAQAKQAESEAATDIAIVDAKPSGEDGPEESTLSKQDDGQITIDVADNTVLIWTSTMVNRLLDLYEEKQEQFHIRNAKHRVIWQAIYDELCREFPVLRNYDPKNVSSKFVSLKRTYKSAVEYLKDDVHTTKWIYFSRMRKVMEKNDELIDAVEKKMPIPTKKNLDGDDKHLSLRPNQTMHWPKRWTPFLLDVYEESLHEVDSATFWTDIKYKMAQGDPEVERLHSTQIQQKFGSLKKAYLQSRRTGTMRKEMSKDIYERMTKLLAGFKDSESETDDDLDVGKTKPTRIPNPYVKLTPLKIDREESTTPSEQTQWSKTNTDLFLDLYIKNKRRINQGVPINKIYIEISKKMNEKLEGVVTPLQCQRRVGQLRHLLRSIVESGDSGTKWPFYEKSVKAFGKPTDLWTRNNTHLLVDLYDETRKLFDESGPRFWEELAAKFKEKRPGLPVTSRSCELKMQALFHKYKATQRRGDGYKERWGLFTKMDKIFSTKGVPWPNDTVQLFLTFYQNNLSRFEGDHQPDDIWESISNSINKVRPQEDIVTASSCKQKMMELKLKYCKLMRDKDAAQAWPLFKRMSELFSSHLWSKSNVNLLLDIYQQHESQFRGSADEQQVWDDISHTFNDLSHSSAVIGPQCQTEMHVLKARYKAIIASGHTNNYSWPFFERMHKIFGDESKKSEPAKKPVNTHRSTKTAATEHHENEYTWSVAATNRLLDLYQANKHLFGKHGRDAVWARIDKELSKADPQYSTGKRGHGGWFKYLDVMTKYMDIKEKRCNEKDWPFYQRMEKIFSTKHAADSPGPASPAPSDVTDASCGSVTDNLHDLLSEKRRAYKRENSDSNSDVDEQESGFACVFLPESADADTSTPSRPKRSRKNFKSLEEDELVSLLDAYAENKHRFSSGEPFESVWKDIIRRHNREYPSSNRSREECERHVKDLTVWYRRMVRMGSKLSHKLRLPTRIYKKMQEISGDTVTPQRTSTTAEHLPNTIVTNGEADILQSILDEIRRKNEINSQRYQLLKKHNEERKKQHEEKMAMLRKIQDTLYDVIGEDKSDVLKTMEKTLEEIHA